MSKIHLTGKIVSVNQFSQLVVMLDKESAIMDIPHDECDKIPWTTSIGNGVICKIKVPNYMKNKLGYFDINAGKSCNITCLIRRYDFLKEAERMKGISLVLGYLKIIKTPAATTPELELPELKRT